MKDVFFERSMFKFDDTTVKGGPAHGMATSDIEIINNCDEETFLTTEESLSLEQQVASSEMDPNLLLQIQKETCADKPELLMPKSLSEELTKQMKICSKDKMPSASNVVNIHKSYPGESAIKCETDVSAKKSVCGVEGTSESFGASTSSGEQLKSTESELSGHEKTSESASSGKRRVRRQTDPDMETSQEFTTADFYIEDSMPSSIADSPPSKGEKQKPEPLIPEKPEEVSVLKAKVQTLTHELEESKDKLGKLVNISQEAARLKSDLMELLTCVKESKTVMSSEMVNTQDSLNVTVKDCLASFDKNLDQFKRSLEEEQERCVEKEKLIAQCNEKEKVLQEKLSENESLIESLNKEIESWKEKWANLECELEKEKENFNKRFQEHQEEHQNKIEEIKKENSLELEVELDKLRSEFQEQILELENKVSEQEAVEAKLKEKISGFSSEKSKEEEKLFAQFQQEKTDITKILQDEHEEKLKKELEACREGLEAKHKEEMESMQKCHSDKLENLMKEQKESLTKEKDDELETLSHQLNTEFEKSYEILKETLDGDYQKALEEFKAQSTHTYKEDKLNLEKDMKKQIDELQLQLNSYTDRMYDHKNSQTPLTESVPQGAQTDKTNTSQSEMQTDQWQGVEMKTQTDITPVAQQEAQTSLCMSEGTEVDTQTDLAAVVQQGAQTNLSMQDGTESNTQTESPEIVQQAMQTSLSMSPEGMNIETQTEPKQQSSQEIQTSLPLRTQVEGSDMETQTDKMNQQQEDRASFDVTNKEDLEKEGMVDTVEIQRKSGEKEAMISREEHGNQMACIEVRLTAEKDKVCKLAATSK